MPRVWILLISLVGLVIDSVFIRSELKGQMSKATVFKGLASAFFVALGFYCYTLYQSYLGKLIIVGLCLGLVGDVLLNLRFNVSKALSSKVFALGILAFLAGHIFYIVVLIKHNTDIIWASLISAVVLSVLAIPQLMKRIKAPSKGLKIFGYVYLVIVICFFSCGIGSMIMCERNMFDIVFTIGGLFFVVSDFIMIYYNFAKKDPKLRVINLLTYFVGQLLIALCVCL